MKLAEALLYRKELNSKVEQLKAVKENGNLYEFVAERVKVSDSLDDVKARVPKVSMAQVTHAYDFHAKMLREIDGKIQQANWTVEIDADVKEYVDPYVK